MNTVLRTPTLELVKAACEKFDQDYLIVEQALKELFNQYPGNNDLRHVLLKVVALNSLYSVQIFVYSTTIPDVEDVARHIYRNAQSIAIPPAVGSPEIVDSMARVTIPKKADRNYFSFATKYCSWHNPESYPIYDSRVDKYLWSLQKQDHFAKTEFVHADLWDYPNFLEVMVFFRNFYNLGAFTFKEIDKFLWSEDGTPSPVSN